MLDWENQGLWLHIPLAKLEAACKGLRVSSATGSNALMCLIAPKCPGSSYYKEISLWEDRGLPGHYFGDDVKLACTHGYLTRTPAGITLISGDFTLVTVSKGVPWTCNLPNKLVLTGAPGSATVGGGPEVVPPFVVSVELTGNYSLAHASSRPHGLDLDNMEENLADWVGIQSTYANVSHAPVSSRQFPSLGSFFSKPW